MPGGERETRQSRAKAYTGRGYAHYRRQDYQAAIKDYTKAIALDRRYPTAYINRGTAFLDVNEYKRAVADFNVALRLKPNSATAYNSRGIAERQLGQYEKAIADYTKAIKLKPGFAAAYSSRGFAYLAKGDNEKAIADYQTVIDLQHNMVWASLQIARAYEQMGLPDYATAFYQQVLSLPGKGTDLDRSSKEAAGERLAALASANTPPAEPENAQADESRQADDTTSGAGDACTEYRLTGNVSFCVPQRWTRASSGRADPARRYRFVAPDGQTSLFAEWQFPEGDPKDDFDTTSYTDLTVGGRNAMLYISVIRGPDSTLHHTLVVFDRPDAKGRQLTFLFETAEANAADMQPTVVAILSSIKIGGASAEVADAPSHRKTTSPKPRPKRSRRKPMTGERSCLPETASVMPGKNAWKPSGAHHSTM